MWLLYRGSDGELALEKFHSKDVPKYAILSHRWLPEDEEPQFHHLHPRPATPETKRKAGYAKLEFCVSEATRDGFGYSWVDTVCINKSSSSELNEAIVSMFRWYGESAKCYAYLNDVAGKSNLCSSKWFTRGWTLQVCKGLYEFRLLHKVQIANRVHHNTRNSSRLRRSNSSLRTGNSLAQSLRWSARSKQ